MPRSSLLAGVAVFCVAVLVHVAALRNGFAYDDVPILLGDPRVLGAAPWIDILTGPYWPGSGDSFGLYRPLVTFTFAADWAVSGGSPAWFHAVNLLWHGAASVLVLVMLRRFFPLAAALAGALLFAVHAVHVEAVANVVGRAEVMAAAFALGAAAIWLRPPSGVRTALAALLFAAALLSKESAVMVPALLVLLDVGAGRLEPTAAGVRAYVAVTWRPHAVLAAVLVGWLLVRGAVLGGIAPEVVHPAAEVARGPLDLFRTALLAWPHFVRLLFFPLTLLADYGPAVILPATEWTRGSVLGLTILIAILGGGALALARGRRRTALALLWFPVALLPASNLLLPIGTLVAERTLYLPSLSVAIGAAALWRIDAWTRLRAAPWRAALALCVLLLAARTVLRTPEWASTESVFAALERDRPDSYRAVWYHARVTKTRDGAAAAHAGFLRAVELWPFRKGLIMEATGNAVEAGRVDDARVLAAHAARTWPDDAATHRMLAATSLDAGDTATAARAIADGLAVDASDALLNAMRAALTPDSTP